MTIENACLAYPDAIESEILLDELSALRKDAARYRFLRDKCVPMDGYHHLQYPKEECDRRIDERIGRE